MKTDTIAPAKPKLYAARRKSDGWYLTSANGLCWAPCSIDRALQLTLEWARHYTKREAASVELVEVR